MELLQAYRNYTESVVRLMVHFAWRQSQASDQPIDAVLDRQVDIRRKTSIWVHRGKGTSDEQVERDWDIIRSQLATRILEYSGGPETQELEEDCWQVLAQLIEPVLSETCPRSWTLMDERYRCWSYDLTESESGAISIHVANAYQPESPFGVHRDDLVSTLMELLGDVRHAHPEVMTVRCGSWLNSYPPFISLFPVEWSDSLVLTSETGANWGWWGQYMRHDVAFHEKNAEVLRRTGRHPYWAGWAHCDIGELVSHLDSLNSD